MQPAWDALLELRIEDEVQVNTPEAMFERLIIRPLSAVPPPPKPVAILIDGLDAMTSGVSRVTPCGASSVSAGLVGCCLPPSLCGVLVRGCFC